MILTRPIEISTVCLLRMTFLLGAIISVLLLPQELALKQWMPKSPKPVREKEEAKPKPSAPSVPPQIGYVSPKIKKTEKELDSHILTVCTKHRIDPALVKAIIMAESGYDPKAVSARGAVGLMQLMPHIIATFGVKDAFNPIHNINGGVKYLSQLLGYFDGDLYLSLAAYNAGISRVGQARTIPLATRSFIEKVLSYYDYYQTGDFKDRI